MSGVFISVFHMIISLVVPIRRALMATLAALILALAAPNAMAATFAEDAQAAAAKGAVTLNDIPAIKSFLSKFGARKLGALKLSNTTFDGGVLKADVKFININWRFTAYSGGTIKNTFFTFGPTSTVSFKKMFKKVPGIELLDILVFDDQMLAIAGADLELDAADLPDGARAEIDRFYEGGDDYTFEVAQGLKLFGALDLGKAKALDDAIKFLGGKSSKVQLTAALSTSILDAMLGGSLPQPELSMTATLPTFRPKIGGVIQLPANVQFAFNSSLSLEGASVGFSGTTDFKIGGQTVPMTLSETITLDTSGAPEIAVAMSIFEGEPWEKAFGLKFLTIEDYAMEMTADASGTMSVGTSGKTTIGGKTFDVATSAQFGTTTAGLPLPEAISLEIDDGPNKVGSLGLKDMLSIYRDLLKVTSGGNINIPLDKVPDVSIAGTEKGKGPKISLTLEAGGGFGFDISGALRVLGSNIATVETAFMSADEGIEIKANSKKLGVGPFSLPNASVHVRARVDRENGTFPPPKVQIHAEAMSLFGSKAAIDVTMLLTSATMLANADFGELFKFDLKAFAGIQNLKKFTDFAKTDFFLAANLRSDPAKWIRTAGKDAVKKAFDGLKPGLNKAVAGLTSAQKEVDKLNGNIASMRKTVKAERAKSTTSIKSAENEVNKLQRDITNLNSKISTNKRKIKSCRQDMKVCWWAPTWSKPKRTKCKSVPNYPARGVCEAANTPWRTAIAGLETAKVGVLAAKVTAQKTLEAVRKGITAIPVDADPRIVGLFSALHTAKIALEAAKQTVKGVGSFTDILAKGVAAVGKVDVFALNKGSIRGSLSQGLKGEPVVLDMDFRLLGKNYKNRFAFSLTDWKFNAKQFEVIALAAAVKTVIKVGKAAKIVPHVLLDEVEKLYLKRQAEVDAAVAKALEGGGVGSNEAVASQGMDREVVVSQKVRLIQNTAARNKDMAARKKIQGIRAAIMQRQLGELAGKSKWTRIAGAANDVGSGANGKTWVIGTNKEGGGYGIYRWDTSKWKKIGGSAVRIDVGPQGHAWVVNNKGNIYRHDGKKWNQVPGGAFDIGVGANGKAWVIGRGKEGGGYGIYRRDGNNWTKIAGSAVRIDVGPKGNAWVVNNKGDIYRHDGKKWVRMPGRAKDIGIGSNGTVMVIGTDDSPYVWNGKTWIKVVGKARNITVARNGDPWVANAGKAIYAWDQAHKLKLVKVAVAKPVGGASMAVKLASGWVNYGGDYDTARVSKSGNLVTVTGLIKNGKYGHVGTLPRGFTPSKRLIFDLSNHAKSARIDVLKDGRILWVAGGKDHKWLSLSGITFNVASTGRLKLASGWATYGGDYGTPTFAKAGNVVTVSGLIKNGKYGHLATLPRGFAPPKRLIFDLNNHAKSARIDVLKDGRILWVTGGKDHKWLSLSGIKFSVKPNGTVKLASGWRAYGGDYQGATFAKSGRIVTVAGLIKNGKYGHLGTLPRGFTPAKRLIFDLSNHGKSARIDVLPDGRVIWVTGGKDHKWLSLSGVSFQAR